MCMRQGYPPVFLKTPGWPSPFLDDLIGKSMADHLRSSFGFPVVPWSPFGRSCFDNDSYLTSAFSSGWASAVFLIAFGAGLLVRKKRRLASWLVAICVIVPIIDTGVRIYSALQREVGHPAAAEFRSLVLGSLPNQMMANLLFQLILPFAVGWALALFGAGLDWIATTGWSRIVRSRR